MNGLNLIFSASVGALAALACGGVNPEAMQTPTGVAPGQPATDASGGPAKGGPDPAAPPKDVQSPEKPLPDKDSPVNQAN